MKPPIRPRTSATGPAVKLWRMLGLAALGCTLAQLPAFAGQTGAPQEYARIEQARGVLANSNSLPQERRAEMDVLQEMTGRGFGAETRGRAHAVLGSVDLLLNNRMGSALRHLRQAQDLLPAGSPEWIETTLALGLAEQHRIPVTPATIATAQQEYKRILEHDPHSLIAARALLQLGRIDELVDYTGDSADPVSAREIYLRIVKQWPDAEIAHEAAFRIGSTYVQEGYSPPPDKREDRQWRESRIQTGIDFLVDWAEAHPDHPLAPGMWEYVGNTYLLLPSTHDRRAYLRAAGDEKLASGGDPAPLAQVPQLADTIWLKSWAGG